MKLKIPLKNWNNSKFHRRTKVFIEEEKQEEISFEEFVEVDKLTITVTKDGLVKSYKDHIRYF